MVIREARRVKHIFSKSIYNNLFNKLNTATSILKNLVDLSIDRHNRRRTRVSERSFWGLHKARVMASSVHKTLICDKYWGCPCQDKHYIRFILDPKSDSSNKFFRLVLTTTISDSSLETLCSWQEMEVESNQARPVERRTPFLGGVPVSDMEHQHCADPEHAVSPRPLSNMRSALSGMEMTEGQRELVGFIPDENCNHYIYIVNKTSGSLYSQTLEEIIFPSPLFPWSTPVGGGPIFKRKDRLHLAAKLACSVLQFHGSWLNRNWNSHDVMFPKGMMGFEESLHHPFLLWSVSKSPEATAG